jgi:hypothetical protein
MEILGLAIVVVLVILAVFLYVMFVPSGNTLVDQRQGLTDPKLASSSLDAMLRTTVYCNYTRQTYSVTELLQDCYYWGIIHCEREMQGNSCDVAKDRINSMLNSTLKKWGRSYLFEAKTSTQDKFGGIANGGCTAAKAQKKPAHQPVPLASGILNVTLRLCS